MQYTELVSKKYIWTNHALKRLKERKISQKLIDQALYFPDRTLQKNNRSLELQKRIDARTVAALVKKNERGENIIVSVWINPPFPGTRDYKKRQRYLEKQKASFWRKLWLTFLDQIGL